MNYVSNTNRLASLNGSAFTYDAVGNTVTDGSGGHGYTYDDTNRLIEVRQNGVLQATYVYNAYGQRVKKVEATGAQRTFYFHYGQHGELLGEAIYASAGQKLAEREYIWLETLPIAFAERTFDTATGAVLLDILAYRHPDHLETPRLATDAAQQVIWRWDSDAFGLGVAETDPDGDGTPTLVGLRFPGQYYDNEAGLNYNYFRDYSPQTGWYLQSDPVGLSGGINTYAYLEDNPIKDADPFGLAPSKVKLPPSYHLKECDSSDWTECEAKCSPNRVLSCKRRYNRRLVGVRNGNPISNYEKADLYCNCDDGFCSRNPKTCGAAVVLGIGLAICLAPQATLPALTIGGTVAVGAQ